MASRGAADLGTTLLYAMGGGLGHLTRMRAFWAGAGLSSSRTALVSASPHAAHVARMMGVEVCAPPPTANGHRDAFRAWLQARIDSLGVTRLVVDAFPMGILGELDAAFFTAGAFADIHHLARRLRFDVYADRAPAMKAPSAGAPFTTTWRLEALEPVHDAWLVGHSHQVVDLELQDPPDPSPPTPREAALLAGGPFTLVVHSGDVDEQRVLAQVAQRRIDAGTAPARVVTAFGDGGWDSDGDADSDADGSLLYPATKLWAAAAVVVSGAGFNAVRQGLALGVDHEVVAFPRALDDQFWRRASRAHKDVPGARGRNAEPGNEGAAEVYAAHE